MQSLPGKNRPYSAMDAYRFMVEHPRRHMTGSDSFYNSAYQQQRTEAWRQSASTAASNHTRNVACSSLSLLFIETNE